MPGYFYILYRSERESWLNTGLQRMCEHCAKVTDLIHWMKAELLVSTESGFPLFEQTCTWDNFSVGVHKLGLLHRCETMVLCGGLGTT